MTITDQTGRQITFLSQPSRIISLVPSQTELLFDLGLDQEVIGITKFCIHPAEWFTKKMRVGGTKQLKIDLIRELKPDLIIANKEENEKEDLELLMNEFPVWISDVRNLTDAIQMIEEIGLITDRTEKSRHIIDEIKKQFSELEKLPILTAAYLIWNDPIMIAACDTFINDMLNYCGFSNAFEKLSRYPQINERELQEKTPDLILLSSEPFPFKEKHIDRFKKICPQSKALLIDGELFSWYGSRLIKAPSYFLSLRKSL